MDDEIVWRRHKKYSDRNTRLDMEIVHGQHKRPVDAVVGSHIDKIARERLTGYHAMSHSVMVMAMCYACDIPPKINCLDFMALSIEPRQQSCR